MCSYKILQNNEHGYVVQCDSCNHIQVAFATVVLSLTTDQFYELIQKANQLYEYYGFHSFPDQKIIHIPTVISTVSMIFSLNELRNFRHLLIEGRNKLQHKQLFVFNEN
jgi:hypothetical protein